MDQGGNGRCGGEGVCASPAMQEAASSVRQVAAEIGCWMRRFEVDRGGATNWRRFVVPRWRIGRFVLGERGFIDLWGSAWGHVGTLGGSGDCITVLECVLDGYTFNPTGPVVAGIVLSRMIPRAGSGFAVHVRDTMVVWSGNVKLTEVLLDQPTIVASCWGAAKLCEIDA